MTEYRTTRRVEFADTDMARIMHFARFFNFMEEVEHEFLRSLGLSVMMDFDAIHVGFPRVAASCDFFKPLKFEDVVDVTLQIERLGSKSITYAIAFSKDGVAVARGTLTTCCVRVDPDGAFHAIAIPDKIREKLA